MDRYEDLDDTQLLARLRSAKGDEDGRSAYRALFDRYYSSLCKQATLRLNGDIQAAEDVVQQVFIDFWVQAKYNVVETSLKSYLHRMVQFKAVDHIRKSVTRKGYETNQSFETVDERDNADAENQARLEKALHSEVASLPEQCRLIFISVYLEGKKYREAAEIHGVSINTVKEQLKRAMVKLRDRMKDFVPVILLLLTHLSPYLQHLNDC